MRQIVLDTETTGLEPSQGHRIIEIGCVELVNRRHTRRSFHQYLQPDREIDEGAIEVHGITNEFLCDKPRFADVAEDFLEFISGAELVIHNAPFDVGFINHELSLLGGGDVRLEDHCTVLDTLELAR
ncbi:MAG TPA: DNA polymerase III subunit epsilon, partial [Thiohalobacter sp.]|nr:DNA polymerase III subunit epsilon [Thiohalobacter sp.]